LAARPKTLKTPNFSTLANVSLSARSNAIDPEVSRLRRLSLLALLLLSVACAQNISAPVAAGQHSGLSIPRISAAPHLSDFEGMQPHGPALQMAAVNGFVQSAPQDGKPASQKTTVYLGYDQSNLYIVWLCFDSDPGAVRTHLERRENIYDDDYVEVMLDTFHDQRHAFVFDVNPNGVQADGLFSEGAGTDNSWDTLWYSAGKVTDKGYMAWESIPFRSLRFHGGDPSGWGVVLYRWIPRNTENDWWPIISNHISGQLRQEGKLEHIEGVSPGRNMQFIPYFAARTFKDIDTRDPVNPRFESKTFDAKAGLDSKFVFHDSLVLDTTINPDFSQVESDDPQNTVNQRFEVFFPEKRPFFLENMNFFENNPGFFGTSQLVFTRRIADPEFGARLTGKMGPWNLGFLIADDRAPGKRVADADPLHDKRAYFAIGRVAHDLGKQSSIGAIFTDREFQGDYNRVGGLDTLIKFNDHWTFNGRSVVSSTLDKINGNGYRYGYDTEAYLNGSGRRFNSVTLLQDISPDFRTETGFVFRTDQRHLLQYAHFYWRPEHRRLNLIGPEGSMERTWDHSGHPVQYNFNGDWVFGFNPNTIIAPIIGIESDILRPVDFSTLTADRKYTQDFVGLVFRSAPSRLLSFSLRMFRQGAINFVPPSGQIPTEADDLSTNLTVTVRPISQLQIDNTYIGDRLRRNDLGRAVFNNHIFRTKWNYQFTREFSLRFIAQFNNLLVNPQLTSLETTRNVDFDILFTYLLHPGTAIYAGYNSDVANLSRDLCVRVAGSVCDPNGVGLIRTPTGFINDGRQVFIKVSYLFRR
jgi:hypothetical protein